MHLFPNNCQHINSHIFAELHPPVFASPTQSERWWINKSWREPRPFQVIFLQTEKISFAEKLKILIHSLRDRHLGSLWVEDLLGGKESLHVGHKEEDSTVVQCRQLIVKL